MRFSSPAPVLGVARKVGAIRVLTGRKIILGAVHVIVVDYRLVHRSLGLGEELNDLMDGITD